MIDLRNADADAASVIRGLGLLPHPEGGHYRETWRDPGRDPGRDPAVDLSRGSGTAILFLLAAGERSHWHRVDAAELWVWQAGAPLTLSRAGCDDLMLGPDMRAGEALQGLVPAGVWQAAVSLGAWTLCTCVVTPAFRFEGFELAPPGWQPT